MSENNDEQHQDLYKKLSGGRAPVDKKVYDAIEEIVIRPCTENSKKLKEEVNRAYPGATVRIYKDTKDKSSRTTNIEIRDKKGIIHEASICREDPDIRSIRSIR